MVFQYAIHGVGVIASRAVTIREEMLASLPGAFGQLSSQPSDDTRPRGV
jgi:hypothetical protein